MVKGHQKIITMNEHKITQGLKTATHVASIFSPPLFLGIFISTQNGFTRTGVGIIAFAVYVALLYGVAGGFDWKLEEISRIRLFFFLALSGFYFGVLLYGLWYMIRKFEADMFNIQFEVMKGKLFSGKWF